jgi:hypothetical protein
MELLAPSTRIDCPRCGAPFSNLERVPRRSIDRLVSLISEQHRYRCRSTGCGWVGNHPAKRISASGAPPMERHYW